MTRRALWLFLLFIFLPVLGVRAAEVGVTVTIDGTDSGGTLSRLQTPSVPESWLLWGRMGASSTVFAPLMLPQGVVTAQASHSSAESSVLILSPGGGSGVQVKAAAKLEAGLYRVAAVLIYPAEDPSLPPATRVWRMESVLLAKPGISAKTVRLRPGQSLIVRWTETISEARAVLQAARRTEAAQGGPTTYTGVTIAKALAQAARLLGEVQTLTTRVNRPEAIRRTHSALLYIAQAQAMARNRPGASAGDTDDMAFGRLTTAFSEISAAMGNLVPSETVTLGSDGTPTEVKISLTNAGQRTISFVTLALPASANAAQAAIESRRRAFRGVAPGATVSARFPILTSPSGPGSTVQFIQGVGAAVITAAPPP